MQKLSANPQTPRFVQLIRWITNPYRFMDESRQRYGDIFTLNFIKDKPFVFICDPATIQEIFTKDFKQFDAGRANIILRPLVGDNSLLLLDGKRHKRQRKLLMPPFHGERIQSYAQLIIDLTKKVANQWETDQVFIVRNVMQEITLKVIMQAVFGLREGSRYSQLQPLLTALLDMTGSPLRSSIIFFSFLQKDWGTWSPGGKMQQRRQKINDLLQAEITERRTQKEIIGNDILSLMMQTQDENGETMSEEELRDEMLTLLFAGHETTATTLAWAFYWIHKLPEVKQKLLQELASLENNLDPIAISNLPYLTAVCNETLRIYPVAPITFPRIAKAPVTIINRQFDAETYLTPCIYLVHHREDLYPNPKQFQPERFLERQYNIYEFMPFGGGNRRCIGYALAQLEMKLVIATILANYQLELAENKPVKPTRRGVTIAPSGGVKIVMKNRQQITNQAV